MVDSSDVVAALDLLLEQVEIQITLADDAGRRAFESRDFEETREAIEISRRVTGFREQVLALGKEWQRMVGSPTEVEPEKERAAPRNLGRLPRGFRTSESAYYIPILQVLAANGGSGRARDVLDQVGEMMKPILKDVDYDPVASSSSLPRWRNTASFARMSMVSEGLLKPSSLHGLSEIADQGRKELAGRT